MQIASSCVYVIGVSRDQLGRCRGDRLWGGMGAARRMGEVAVLAMAACGKMQKVATFEWCGSGHARNRYQRYVHECRNLIKLSARAKI